VRAEFVVSARGLEGGGIYAVSRAVREGAALALDLAPDRTEAALAERLAAPQGKESTGNYLRKRLGLDPVKLALLLEWGRPLPEGAALARLVKRLPVGHAGMRPMDEAISTAGGVRWEAVDEDLMLTAMPGVFVAGEMLDWEAPTGGYLLTACLATGRWAGQAAARW
jgi:predicted flavoprotein YhiN